MIKKSVVYSVLFFLLCNNTYGQLSDSLLSYYHQINKAELAIIDSNYTLAIEFYQGAFLFNPQPFKKDIYNKAVCAALIKDYNKAYSDFKHLADYSYEINLLTKRKELGDFFDSKYGKKLLKYNKKNIQLYNHKLRETYDSLYRMDQFFRKKEGSYDVYGDTIEKIDNSNADVVNQLISKYGFPSQELIGVYPNFDYNAIRIIVIHNQAGNSFGQYFNFTEILYDAVYSGKLDSREALQLITGSTGDDYYGFMSTGLVRHGLDTNGNPENMDDNLSNWGFSKLKDEEEQEYNKRREEIGLCTLEDSRRKTFYYLKDKRFYLTSPSSMKTFYWRYEKDYRYAISKLIFIE